MLSAYRAPSSFDSLTVINNVDMQASWKRSSQATVWHRHSVES